MNQLILDGCIQKDTKLYDEIANFNISAITGSFLGQNNQIKKRFTYLKVIFPHPITPELENLLQPKSMVRIYGKIDSEQYHTISHKNVYNKIICAEKIVRIRWDNTIKDYVEVI